MHKKLILIGAVALFCFGVPKIHAQETETVIVNEEGTVNTGETAVTTPNEETTVVTTPTEEAVIVTTPSEEETTIVVTVPNEEGTTGETVETGETNNTTPPVTTGGETGVVVVPLSAQTLVASGVVAATAFMLM